MQFGVHEKYIVFGICLEIYIFICLPTKNKIEAHFIDVNKCLALSNLLVEKLGPGITVSLPACYHSSGSLDRLR